MSKFKSLVSTIISGFIVMSGAICLTGFILSPVSFTSVLFGVYGGWVLFPAIKNWEKTFNTILNND